MHSMVIRYKDLVWTCQICRAVCPSCWTLLYMNTWFSFYQIRRSGLTFVRYEDLVCSPPDMKVFSSSLHLKTWFNFLRSEDVVWSSFWATLYMKNCLSLHQVEDLTWPSQDMNIWFYLHQIWRQSTIFIRCEVPGLSHWGVALELLSLHDIKGETNTENWDQEAWCHPWYGW